MRYLAQIALVGVVVMVITVVIHGMLKTRFERAISKALDFDQEDK